MPKFDEIQVGDKAHLNRIITKADIETFAALTLVPKQNAKQFLR